MPFYVEDKRGGSKMKNERGISLITLSITILLLIILTFTLTVNIEPYRDEKAKTNFEIDMQRLNEEINQYFARVKQLPISRQYTNTSMLEGIKNVNDNENYYVIDIRQLDVVLNNGADYKVVLTREETEDISDLTDLYIINEQSHTIYYPKGVKYKERTLYRLEEVYSKI